MAPQDLARMVNQIAENFSYLEPGAAAEATAAHVMSYWAPSMRDELCAEVRDDDLVPVAQAARSLLSLRRPTARSPWLTGPGPPT